LLDGTATVGERMMVLGILAAHLSFFLVFVGIGLMFIKEISVVALLFPLIPGLWLYGNLREDWREYRQAKQKVAKGHLERTSARPRF
jgi:hypothetical protein